MRHTSIVLALIGGLCFSMSDLTANAHFNSNDSITVDWLNDHLKQEHPRLFFSPTALQQLSVLIEEDELAGAYYQYLSHQADEITGLPTLERKKEGRRLLGVSREALRRLGILALIYRIDGRESHLNRLETELKAVCSFSDWNPDHFLDVAEMATAVAIAVDWAGGYMSKETEQLARRALKEKALMVSLEEAPFNWWINASHNWNQVCHAGMTAAALVLADEEPELAVTILNRAISKLPLALEAYAPDGAYPEGPSYWVYGTGFNVLMLDMLQSALGTDFGLGAYPGFMESATFWRLSKGPSGLSFNYSDCNTGSGLAIGGDQLMLWFAPQSGNAAYLERDLLIQKIKKAAEEGKQADRLSSIAMAWLVSSQLKESKAMPELWKADGINPIAMMRGPDGFYLGIKGGAAEVNHGNMDAGSFILEWKGVRWSVDPGNQDYNELEQIMGGELWNRNQNSRRWTLLTKNNYAHSTLTINDSLHRVEGFAPVSEFSHADTAPEISVDLSGLFGEMADGVSRRFIKKDENSLIIEDAIRPNEQTRTISWAMMTQADIRREKSGLVLEQNSQMLKLTVLEPADARIKVESLDPPPLPYDKRIENLQRIVIEVEPEMTDQVIRIRLSGN